MDTKEMEFKVEELLPDNSWRLAGGPFATKPFAEMCIAASPRLLNKVVRIVPMDFIHGRLFDAKLDAEIALLRALVEDLDYGKDRYSESLTAIINSARKLLAEEELRKSQDGR